MASPSHPPPSSEVPENLLLNPRASALREAAAPLSQVPSNLPPWATRPPSDPNQLSPEDEEKALFTTFSHKAIGNTYFSNTPPDYETAISYYRSGLESCPIYRSDHRTILFANIAACWIKLEKWKEAEEAATSSLKESGEDDDVIAARRRKLQAEKDEKEKKTGGGDGSKAKTTGDEGKSDRVEELPDDEELAEAMLRIGMNWKARLRRAKAREMQGTWQSYQGALDDYKILAANQHQQPIPAVDQQNIKSALNRIPGLVEQSKQKEIAEMMGKLRGLGDSILKPFGLSTESFNMVKDPNSGGYSLNFNNAGGSSNGSAKK